MILDNNKRNPSNIQSTEITPKQVFENRRLMLKTAGLGLGASLLGLSNLSLATSVTSGETKGDGVLIGRANDKGKASIQVLHKNKLNFKKTAYGSDEKLTKFEDVTTYNNYYEFGTSKSDPAENSTLFKARPWTISIEGEVKKAKAISIEDLMKLAPLEERIYRMRCVEAWSMVIPWIGLPLASLIKWAEPTGNAKYIEFISANDPLTMPGARVPILDWPYVEGLRMDEANHPLALLAVGLYGEVLPNQNGAPVRLVVPWKYGFKGAKAITKIRFVEKMPVTTWAKAGPNEYGFYANVNPNVDHPRWTQSSERRIGAGLFAGRSRTQMFNGYEEVASLYAGMDLKRNF
jgi:methionine sulfoxide reductase catalytic subunit